MQHTDLLSQFVPEVVFRDNLKNIGCDIIELSSIQARVESLNPRPDQAHRVKFNAIILVEQGEGQHNIDFEKIAFQAGSIIVINTGQIHAFDFMNPLKGKVIVYTDQFLNTLNNHITIPYALNISMPQTLIPHILTQSNVSHTMANLTNELALELQRACANISIVTSLFASLAMILSRERNALVNDVRTSDIHKFIGFKRLVEENCHISRDANFYANKLAMTYKNLNSICKSVTGETPKKLIDLHVILEAKRRMAIEQIDIASLASMLGFEETTNFTKFFKRYTASTPSQFRKAICEQIN